MNACIMFMFWKRPYYSDMEDDMVSGFEPLVVGMRWYDGYAGLCE